jgi:hypothetical protein
MTALPSPDFSRPVQDFKRPKASPISRPPSIRKAARRSRATQQNQVFAATGKLALYSFLSVLGILSLVNLVNYSLAQQSKLHQLKSEVKDAKQRVEAQNAEFQHSFDPRSGKLLMQENSYRIAADQQPIILYNGQQKR